jgi:hypothetical protein
MTVSSLHEPEPCAAEDLTSSPRPSRWSLVARRTVYFGHQSVGSDVCAGIRDLATDYSLPLTLVQTREPESVTGPAFVSFLAGRHRDYASKNAAMLRLLESPTRARNPLVLLKYCYGDITSPSEYRMLFDAYRDTVDTIEFEHPDVALIHSTIPLTTVESGFKARTKRYLGRTTRRDAALGRHRYNELLRAEFGGFEPIFDIAQVQALNADGTISGFASDGSKIETLAVENTAGGTDLNPRCRRLAAEALLDLLSTVVEDI